MTDHDEKRGPGEEEDRQKTSPKKAAPLRVADEPPQTPEGRRLYNEEALEKSEDYAERRADETSKPYSTEVEDLREEAEKAEDDGKV